MGAGVVRIAEAVGACLRTYLGGVGELLLCLGRGEHVSGLFYV